MRSLNASKRERRGRRASAGLLAGISLLAFLGCSAPEPANVVLITFDTTRADRLGPYGYEEGSTPTLDRMAQQGFTFDAHMTPIPITLPAHTTLLTGLTPPAHTVRDNGTFTVPEDALTLAEILQEEGYDTSAFVASFPLEEQFNLDQGFGHYDDEFSDHSTAPLRPQMDIFFDERRAGAVVDAALRYHRERRPGPFFTFLHFFDPHQPQLPPSPYDVQFRAQPYDGEIAYADEQLGRFLNFLEERGDLDNTLVIFTSDHGEGLGEHGEVSHAMLLHQATLRIPLILQGPGVSQGRTSEWTFSTQIFATVLDYLGLDTPELPVEPGHSLLPLMANEGEAPEGWPRFNAYFETIAPRASQGWAQQVGFMRESWRLVEGPRPTLYDLDQDPRELDNRHAQ